MLFWQGSVVGWHSTDVNAMRSQKLWGSSVLATEPRWDKAGSKVQPEKPGDGEREECSSHCCGDMGFAWVESLVAGAEILFILFIGKEFKTTWGCSALLHLVDLSCSMDFVVWQQIQSSRYK